MIINNNMSAMNAHRQLGANQGMAAKAQEKLSSGLRINRAGDDAAGLAISEKMRAQVRGLDQASRNSQDGISMIQTAEGALNETHSILQRMRELAVQSSNDSNTDDDRAEIQKEVDALAAEISRISDATEFNKQKLIDGSANLTFQVGANQGQNISLSIGAMDAVELGVGTATEATEGSEAVTAQATADDNGNITYTQDGQAQTAAWQAADAEAGTVAGYFNGGELVHASAAALAEDDTVEITLTPATEATEAGVAGIDVSTRASADEAITSIEAAITSVSSERSKLGATQNRLEHTISNLDNSSENLQAAESRIRDVDMAKEIMEFTKQNILSQASQSMLAQANQAPQQVLQLLG
ncbi:flagellin protein FlaA [Bacillus sp. JCM 19045]|nr:flagellin protein FlaA [Bacillus sp. JCM 19045]